MKIFLSFSVIAVLLLGAVTPSVAAIAYMIPAGTAGTQNFTGTYGMDFNVTAPQGIRVTRIGVFDSNSDGINGTIVAGIFDRTSQNLLGTVSLTGTQGDLVGGSRFVALLTPLNLPNGFQGTIAAQGYNAAELGGNAGAAGMFGTTDDGGGLISFVGTSRFGNPGVFEFPGTPDGGDVNRYGAGTFEYDAVPEPSAALLLGLAALLGFRRRR